METDIVYPWGPLLLKQKVNSSLIEEFISKYPKNGKDLEVNILKNISRKTYPKDTWDYFHNLLLPYFNKYIEYLPIKYQFKIVDLWINTYKPYESVPMHIHSNCDLSFVLYAKTPENEEEGKIIFSYGESQDARSKVGVINSHSISPKVNDLFIFPNNLRHQALHYTNPKSERISISGNIELL